MLTLLYLTCHVLLTVVTMLIVGKHHGACRQNLPLHPHPQETGLGTPLTMGRIGGGLPGFVNFGQEVHKRSLSVFRPKCILNFLVNLEMVDCRLC